MDGFTVSLSMAVSRMEFSMIDFKNVVALVDMECLMCKWILTRGGVNHAVMSVIAKDSRLFWFTLY